MILRSGLRSAIFGLGLGLATSAPADDIVSAEDIQRALSGVAPANATADVSGTTTRSLATRGINGITPSNAPASLAAGAVSLNTITFATNSAELTDQGVKQVDQVAVAVNSLRSRSLKANTAYLVVGHTDRQGEPVYNLSLSVRRAQSVVTRLVQSGVQASEIQYAGVGQQFLAFPEDPTDSERNRRVEVINCKINRAECEKVANRIKL